LQKYSDIKDDNHYENIKVEYHEFEDDNDDKIS